MRITDFSFRKQADYQELSASLDGRRLWYRIFSGHGLEIRADPFVIVGLLVAMSSRKDIVVDPSIPLSPKLSEGIGVLQGIYSCFNSNLRPVSIRATLAPSNSLSAMGGIFFSGGLDGLHTFLRNREEIGALIFIRGIDFSLDNEQLFREAMASSSHSAARYRKKLIRVETNVRDFIYPSTPIGLTALYGPILASVAHVLSFERTYIAAGLSFNELGPEGDFPLTWPLWTTEGCSCICDGAECTRLDKMRFVATQPDTLDELRICVANSTFNCNQCEKCLINRAMLRALGLTSTSIRHLDDLKDLERIRITDIEALTFCRQTLQAAEAAGDHALARVLRKKIFQYLSRQMFWQLDRNLLNGGIRRRWRRLRGAKSRGPGTSLRERLDFKHPD